MNKNAIQKFAIWARNELIAQVSQRAYQYGIDESGFGDASADTLNGRLLTAEETLAMEPQLAPTVAGALFAPSAAIVSPWEFALAMAEVAVRNGVELYRSTPVTNIEKIDGGWQLTTPNGSFAAR